LFGTFWLAFHSLVYPKDLLGDFWLFQHAPLVAVTLRPVPRLIFPGQIYQGKQFTTVTAVTLKANTLVKTVTLDPLKV